MGDGRRLLDDRSGVMAPVVMMSRLRFSGFSRGRNDHETERDSKTNGSFHDGLQRVQLAGK
jgi:hypothetical protein